MLVVDTRWSGQNGIGRYAHEVLARVTTPWMSMPEGGSPSSPVDFLVKRLSTADAKPTGVYSPGYNGFLRPLPQTVTVLDLIHLEGPSSRKYRGYYDLFLKPLIRRNRHCITISETSKSAIEAWLGDTDVEVVNAGMGSTPAFRREGPAAERPRPYFLYVGSLREHKNVNTIVEALALLPAFDLVVVAPDVHAVEALAAAKGVGDRVHPVTGLSDDGLAELYRGARATLQPSTLEGFGLPALESALCGTPVIFFEGCASVREICAGGGVSVPAATDSRQWADAMSGIPDHATFPEGHVDHSMYSWDSVAGRIDDTLSRFHA